MTVPDEDARDGAQVDSRHKLAGRTEPMALAFWTKQSPFTDPGDSASMLDLLPHDAPSIAEVARGLTVHHNLRTWYGIPVDRWKRLVRVWPPRAEDVLRSLADMPPGNISGDRLLEHRVLGACMLESHLLACLLHVRDIPARVRAGYFSNVMENRNHIVEFWLAHQWNRRLLADPAAKRTREWEQSVREYTDGQVDVNHHIEHWICEYWSPRTQRWTVLDANTDFLEAHSDIAVGVELPPRYFQFAHDAWACMRDAADFTPDRYVEEPQDGRSHIRSQLLFDFFSLTGLDIVGVGDGPETARIAEWQKERRFSDVTAAELTVLDEMAQLLGRDESATELLQFGLRRGLLVVDGENVRACVPASS